MAVGTTFDWKADGAKIHSTLHTVEINSLLGWTGKAFGTFAIHNWRLEETAEGTRVYVEESLEGFLPRWFKKAFAKSLEKGMQKMLNELKTESEKQ